MAFDARSEVLGSRASIRMRLASLTEMDSCLTRSRPPEKTGSAESARRGPRTASTATGVNHANRSLVRPASGGISVIVHVRPRGPRRFGSSKLILYETRPSAGLAPPVWSLMSRNNSFGRRRFRTSSAIFGRLLPLGAGCARLQMFIHGWPYPCLLYTSRCV